MNEREDNTKARVTMVEERMSEELKYLGLSVQTNGKCGREVKSLRGLRSDM